MLVFLAALLVDGKARLRCAYQISDDFIDCIWLSGVKQGVPVGPVCGLLRPQVMTSPPRLLAV